MLQIFEKIAIFILGLTVTLGFYFSWIPAIDIMYIGICANIFLIVKSRKFKPMAFMFIFWLTFIINLIPYYKDGIDISGPGRNMFDSPELYNRTMFHHVFFLLVLAFFFPKIKQKVYLKDRFVYDGDILGFVLTISFMVYIFLFGQTGESIFTSGGYTKNSQTSSLNEYFIVLVPVALMFTGNTKNKKRLVYTLVFLYLLKDLSFGGRNLTVQNLALLFLLFDSPKIKYWQLIIISSIPVYFLLLYGTIRQNPILLFTSSLSDLILIPFKGKVAFLETLITQNDVYYASVRFIGLIEMGVIKQDERFTIFLNNVLAIVTPYKYLPESTSLAQYKMKEYNAGGGGLISAYWYVFLGLPGLLFIGWYISFVIRKTLKTTNKYFLLYSFVFFSSYVRWFAYNPIIIFKLCIYGVLFYIIIKLMKNIMRHPIPENF